MYQSKEIVTSPSSITQHHELIPALDSEVVCGHEVQAVELMHRRYVKDTVFGAGVDENARERELCVPFCVTGRPKVDSSRAISAISTVDSSRGSSR